MAFIFLTFWESFEDTLIFYFALSLCTMNFSFLSLLESILWIHPRHYPKLYRSYVLINISEIIKVGVVTIDVSSIGIKFENFMQAGCRDLGSHCGGTVYYQKPIILPNLALFFGTFLELPALPSIIFGWSFEHIAQQSFS